MAKEPNRWLTPHDGATRMKHNHMLILLRAVKHGACLDFQNLNELAGFVEHAMQSELARRTQTAEKVIASIADEIEKGFLAECHAEEIIQVEKEFPRIQRYALFTTAMCLIESYITELCKAAQKMGLTTEDFSNQSPGVIPRGIEYLQNKAAIDLSRHCYYIDLAASLVSLRNCIVHDNGEVRCRRGADAIREFVSHIPTLSIDKRDRLELKPGFIENMSHEMHMFIDLILERMRKQKEAPTTGSSVP